MTEAYVEKTQKELGAIISSPKLTEKLLSKPPFRFLHDIVTNFISATGFPQGLFPDELLDSNNVTDKAKKIEFLTLLIAGVEAATGTKVTANPSKIVAGHEADHTNALLQQLASCAALSPDKKAAAVQKVKGGGEGEQPSAARKSSRKEDEEKAEKEKQEKEQQQQQQQQQKDEERRKRKEEAKKREQEASAAAAAAEITKRHGTDEKKKRREDEAPAPSGETNEAERRKPQEEEVRRSSKQRKGDDGHGARHEEGGEGKRKGGETLEDKTPKTEDDERRKRHEERRRREKEAAAAGAEREDSLGNTEKTVALSRTARSEQRSSSTTNATATTTSTTTAAGKAPPRTKPTHEVMDDTQVSATPVPGVIQEGKSKKNKTAQDAVDENEWMRVAEQQEAKPVTTGGGINTGGANEGEAKGYLGQQALKAKRDQEEEAARRAEEAKASALQGGGGGGIIIHSSKGGKSGSTMAEGELSKLREQLQLLTKASNPLGKLLEAIYDDIDTMGRELEMWRSEARSQALAAADAKRQTTESLQEVHAQLQNLEDAINDQILKTHNIRRNVINNDNAVAGMVRMIVSPDIGR